MSDLIDFGFDEAKIVKVQGVEAFKQSRPGEVSRVSVIAFKKFHDVVLAAKTREKGEALTDKEKAELIVKIDGKLAEQLGKKVEDLTEVDRLDIKSPRFSMAMTHFGEGVGTIRCLGEYAHSPEGVVLVKPGLCCRKFGDADQKIGTVVMSYPVDDHNQVDGDLLAAHKYTSFWVWSLNARKFKRLESSYADARADKKPVIDLKVTLDGDPKFQKQLVEQGGTAFWAREDTDPAIRNWVLEQGLRAWKYVSNNLGFEITAEKLAEKLGVGGVASAQPADDSTPKLANYDKLFD